MKVQVGQQVFSIFHHLNGRTVSKERSHRVLTVTKVGRKWAEFECPFNGRFSLENGEIDGRGYSSPGYVYESKEAWIATKGIDIALNRLGTAITSHKVSDGLSYESIRQAATLLGVDIDLEYEWDERFPQGTSSASATS